jgi:hypothetical protein
MLFREAVAVYCGNHTKHANILGGQNAEFYYVKGSGAYNNHCALKGLKWATTILFIVLPNSQLYSLLLYECGVISNSTGQSLFKS